MCIYEGTYQIWGSVLYLYIKVHLRDGFMSLDHIICIQREAGLGVYVLLFLYIDYMHVFLCALAALQ